MIQAAPGIDYCSNAYRSNYDRDVLDDVPVAYYPLSQYGALDCAGTSLNGTKHNNPTTQSSALPNGDTAAVFNGSDQYIQVGDNDKFSIARTGEFTIEAWIRPDTLEFPSDEGSGYVHWLGKGETNQHEYVSRMYSLTNSENRPNRISGYAYNLSGGLGAGSYFQDNVAAGDWIHYTLIINTESSVSYPMGYTKLFKNGSFRDIDSLAGYSIVPANGTAPLRIGTRDLQSYFQGAIAKVAFYDYELSPSKILGHYQSMVPPGDEAVLLGQIGTASEKTNSTTMTIPVTENVVAGNTVFVRVLHSYTSGGPTMTDSKGNTYTRDRTAPSTGNILRGSIFSARVTSALAPGDTITLTTSATTAARVATADAFSGVMTSVDYLDTTNGTSGNSASPSVTATTTNNKDLIIAMVGVNNGMDDAYTEDSLRNWLSLQRAGTISGSGDISLNSAYKNVSTTGGYSYQPTLETSSNWVEILAAYKLQE